MPWCSQCHRQGSAPSSVWPLRLCACAQLFCLDGKEAAPEGDNLTQEEEKCRYVWGGSEAVEE